MNYDDLRRPIAALDFIDDAQMADAAVKTVLGILVSRMGEAEARALTGRLPEPLTYEMLRSHPARPTPISADEFFASIARQFNLEEDQATRLVQEVLHATRESLPDEEQQRLAANLPEDFSALFTAA